MCSVRFMWNNSECKIETYCVLGWFWRHAFFHLARTHDPSFLRMYTCCVSMKDIWIFKKTYPLCLKNVIYKHRFEYHICTTLVIVKGMEAEKNGERGTIRVGNIWNFGQRRRSEDVKVVKKAPFLTIFYSVPFVLLLEWTVESSMSHIQIQKMLCCHSPV